ncbi:uncharacterized protein LOC116803458 [Drosophila sechellia]|uniref:uncharacterized protein LOC116803458 n=1 Tax=Drosophila sechellia TaxID=7238 RepID=UPI0013DE511C|nr:uncharacterized protein LOC116803458 [Drosophila sechellia]
MASNKDRKKTKKANNVDENSEPQLLFQEVIEETDVLDLNLYSDINDDFFNEANRVVQFLMEAKRHFEASRIKRYSDIIFNLHRRYVVGILSSEKKLRLALELTSTSQEAMQKLRDLLGDAWKESDASALREQLVQEKLQEVLIKCEGLGDRNSGTTDDTAE